MLPRAIAAAGDEIGAREGERFGSIGYGTPADHGCKLCCLPCPSLRDAGCGCAARCPVAAPAGETLDEILAAPAQPALLQQHHQTGSILAHTRRRSMEYCRRLIGSHRQSRNRLAQGRNPPCAIKRAQRLQRAPCGGHGSFGRGIEPRQTGRIRRPPLRQPQQQRCEVGLDDFGGCEFRAASVPCLFPEAIGDPRPLPGRTPGPLRCRGLRGTAGDKMRGPRRPVEFGEAGKAGVDHHADTVQSKRGLGNRRRQHDPAAALRIAPYRGALGGGLDLAVERVDRGVGQAHFQTFAHPLDLAHAGEEGEDIARFLAPGGHHCGGYAVLDSP